MWDLVPIKMPQEYAYKEAYQFQSNLFVDDTHTKA